MKSVKFIHFADLHLGMPFSYLLNTSGTDISLTRRLYIEKTLEKITNLALEQRVDAVFAAGDLFEHGIASKENIAFINNNFRKLSPVKVFIVPGNHDPYFVDSYYRTFDWSDNVVILAGENTSYKDDSLQLAVYGMGYDTYDIVNKSCIESALNIDKSFINVFMVHGTPDLAIASERYNVIPLEWVDKFEFDYVAFGHFHNLIMEQGSHKNIFNPGSPESLGFDEPGEHGVIVGRITKDDKNNSRIQTVFVRTSQCEHFAFSVDVGNCSCDEDVIDLIKNWSSGLFASQSQSLLRVEIAGAILNAYMPDARYIAERLSKDFLFVQIIDNTNSLGYFQQISTQPGLKGAFVSKMLNRIQSANNQRECSILKNALLYGIKAIDEGRVSLDHIERCMPWL